MVAQTASLAGATPEQTAALLRQLVQAGAASGGARAAGPQQHAQQAQQQQLPMSLSAPAPAVNGAMFGHAAHGAFGEADVKPAMANMDKATRAAMFGPKGQVRPGQCRRMYQ